MPEARVFRRAGRGKSATSGSTRGEWVALIASPSPLLYRFGNALFPSRERKRPVLLVFKRLHDLWWASGPMVTPSRSRFGMRLRA